jgi:inner membrane protein
MMVTSHLVVGAAAWAVAARLGGGSAAELPGLVAAMAGALLPDLDHPSSWVGRRLRPLSVPLSMLLGHRGLSHSLIAVVAGLWALNTWGIGGDDGGGWTGLPAPLAVGYLSHLAADGLTPAGVPLLWPIKRRFCLPLCRTGSPIEIAVVAMIVAAGLWAAGLLLTGW